MSMYSIFDFYLFYILSIFFFYLYFILSIYLYLSFIHFIYLSFYLYFLLFFFLLSIYLFSYLTNLYIIVLLIYYFIFFFPPLKHIGRETWSSDLSKYDCGHCWIPCHTKDKFIKAGSASKGEVNYAAYARGGGG